MRTMEISRDEGGTRFEHRGLLIFITLALVFAFGSSPAQADDDDGVASEESETGEIVVKINPRSNATIEQINSTYETTTRDAVLASGKIYLLEAPENLSADDLSETMETDTRLLYAEPNYAIESPEGNPRRHAARSTDYRPVQSSEPDYSAQYAIGAIRLGTAHRTEDGAGTTVAVLDTGVQGNHPELAGSLVAGYDYVEDNADPSEAESGEMVGHGTHVAGIVHLTAPAAKIMPMRVLDADGKGDVFLIAEAVQGAVERGADVINLSLGSSEESDLLEDVFKELSEPEDDDDLPAVAGVPREGVVVVGAAGNNNSVTEQYPSAEDGVISVASVDQNEQKSEFSSFGPEWVDVAAPGEDIHSLFPASGYASWDGTSMATPFVAGQAALIRGLRPNLPAARDDDDPANASVEGVIKSSARALADKSLGAGHADAARSLNVANLAPSVTPVNPKPGARIKSRTPVIAATVRDPGSTLAKSNIRLFVRGVERKNFTYAPSTGRLSFKTPKLPYGATGVRIVARDDLGKSASRSWSFRVIR
ncbi:MAG: S8 family serine peptidase [Rubrobacter sp.]